MLAGISVQGAGLFAWVLKDCILDR